MIERCQFKVNDPTNFADEEKIIYWKKEKWIRTACSFNEGTARERENRKKRKRAFFQLDPVFKYLVDFVDHLELYMRQGIQEWTK